MSGCKMYVVFIVDGNFLERRTFVSSLFLMFIPIILIYVC